jgi:myo-inositol 2-dehydrogenase / D-chiro-inositol 1-dehydrogenase
MPRKSAVPSRRSFLQASAAATAAGGVLLQTSPVRAAGNDVLKIGLIGCGGRGGGAALNALTADKGTRLVAMCDAFGDRLETKMNELKEQFGDRVDVPKERRYTGFDGYKQLIDSDVDVVLLVTPPGFRPIHYKYAVEKGKHVFMEKPHAVDATGIRSVLETTKVAKEKKLCVVSGFCYRYDPPKRETLKRIHDGQIGRVLAVHTTYLTGDLWFRGNDPTWTPMDYQMRNWYYFTWISGDFMIEQHIHSIDKAAWVMNGEMPIAAQGMGGRQTRTDAKFGNIWDHFTVVYEYASGAKVFSQCRQVGGCHGDVSDHVIGTKGSAQLMKHTITTDAGTTKATAKAKRGDMYQVEHDEFFAHIRAGTVINDAESSAYSSLMGIMGREAAYSGQRITWDEIQASKQNLSPAQYAFGDNKVPSAPVPGKYKFV